MRSAVHDLTAPANRLRLVAQLLGQSLSGQSQAVPDEDSRKLLGYIEESAAAVNLVAEGMRSYAEICHRERTYEPLDLNVSLAAAIADHRAEIESSGARIHTEPLPKVCADSFQIMWLFRELLTNALRFRASCPLEVNVSYQDEGAENWFVAVADNGSGIGREMAERVFLPFKRLAGHGAGLGLTICRRIVELHGGEIWVEPRDSGTEIRFFLGNRASASGDCD